MKFFKKPLLEIINNHIISYPTPININFAWNFGFMSAICLTIQILTGVLVAMHYTPHVSFAFLSVESIMRDVQSGWILRYVHSNGASFCFIATYIHILRSLYYGSYIKPKQTVWVLGVIIFLFMIITAFMGYVLPWGQMSYWGATVITSLATAIPFIGDSLVLWLWGDFSISNAALNRFFSLHYLFPIIIAALVFLHLAALHFDGSNNPLGLNSTFNKIAIYPYFILKDFVGLAFFLIAFSIFLIYYPNLLNHEDNYIKCSNPLVTPHLILPEWQFLIYYAILRSIPIKLGGVIAMLFSILILIFLPWIHSFEIRSSRFRSIYKLSFWSFLACCLLLGWIGSQPVELIYVAIGQIASVYYFSYLLIVSLIIYLLKNMPFRFIL
nr:cytochrome b [Porphyridium purpureum]UBY46111.1 cytochrome b [Porphyridium purpureum]